MNDFDGVLRCLCPAVFRTLETEVVMNRQKNRGVLVISISLVLFSRFRPPGFMADGKGSTV